MPYYSDIGAIAPLYLSSTQPIIGTPSGGLTTVSSTSSASDQLQAQIAEKAKADARKSGTDWTQILQGTRDVLREINGSSSTTTGTRPVLKGYAGARKISAINRTVGAAPTTKVIVAGSTGKVPRWVLPVAIGIGGAVAVYMMTRR